MNREEYKLIRINWITLHIDFENGTYFEISKIIKNKNIATNIYRYIQAND